MRTSALLAAPRALRWLRPCRAAPLPPRRAALAPTVVLAVISSLLAPRHAIADAEAPAALGDAIGAEIDADERWRYGLFPDVRGFESGRFDSTGRGYRLTYAERGEAGSRSHRRSVSRESFQQTCWHVAFVEEYESLGDAEAAARAPSEAEVLRRLALRYAARKRYDLAKTVAEDLRDGNAASPDGRWAAEALPRFDALAGPRRALIWPGSLLDQRGRTDLLAFSGYYGLWLGAAIPVALGAEDAQAYAAGLLAAPAACVLLASNVTRNAPISQGQATIISLGGHLGTWQGLGWAGLGDADGNATVATGVVAGLGGILLAVPVSNALGFSEGHASVTNSAMYWGGWFGLVESVLSGRDEGDEDSPLVDMLVGSDIGVVAAGIAARGARLSKGRMRLINLCGVLGTAFGGGLALLVETDDDKAALALLGGGSAAGLALGTHWTRDHDRGKDFAAGPAVPPGVGWAPALSMRPPRGRAAGPVPAAGIRVVF